MFVDEADELGAAFLEQTSSSVIIRHSVLGDIRDLRDFMKLAWLIIGSSDAQSVADSW